MVAVSSPFRDSPPRHDPSQELHLFHTSDPRPAPRPAPSPPPPPDPPRLRRQRTFAPGCCSFCDPDFLPPALKDCLLYPSHSVIKDDPNHQPGNVTWWQDSWRLLGSRRKVEGGHSSWVDDAVISDEPYYRPPRWRLFLRKIRAQTRKMNCSKPAPPGFHYDPLSYAMNFDDGCWHHGDSQSQALHPSRFSGPILMEGVSFKGSS